MKKTPLFFLAFIAVALLFAVLLSAYTVKQWEQALVLRFGDPVRVINVGPESKEAGLKFRIPGIERVIKFDKRNLELDMEPEQILASNQERLLVDAFIRYQISDPRQYYQTLNNRQRGEKQMKRIMDSTLRDVLGRVTLKEIVSGKRAALMNEIEKIGNRKAKEDKWGLEIIDVRIRTADLPPQNARLVEERMISYRKKESAEKLAHGQKRATTIRAQADKEVTVTIAKAQEKAEIIKGEGEAKKNEVLAKAYNLDPEFAKFYLAMDAYQGTLTQDTTFILSPDSDFLEYLRRSEGGK